MRIATLERPDPSGWRLAMHLIEVAPGKLLVHSPTWLGADTRERVEEHGRPEAVFAPNHYHHLSVGRFQDLWGCAAYAAEGALPRLRHKGHEIEDVTRAAHKRLGDVRVVPLPEVKTGEAWLVVPGDAGDTLIVCDAFLNVPGPVTGLKGAMLRALRAAPDLKLPRTFEWMGLRDRRRYVEWAAETLTGIAPARVLFSHGEALRGDDCAEKLIACMRATLA